jgi:hypothetical protein
MRKYEVNTRMKECDLESLEINNNPHEVYLTCLDHEIDKHIVPILNLKKPFDYLEKVDPVIEKNISFILDKGSDFIGEEEQYYTLLKKACFYNYNLCKIMLSLHSIPSDIRQVVNSKLQEILESKDYAMFNIMPTFGISLFESKTKQIDYCYYDEEIGTLKLDDLGPLHTTNLLETCRNYCHTPNESIAIFASAMKSWEAVANIHFNQVSFYDPKCRVYLAEVTSYLFKGTTGFLAHHANDGDMVANLVLLDILSKRYWPFVSVHELGHVLGLDHTTKDGMAKFNYYGISPENDHQEYSIMSYNRPRGLNMHNILFKKTPSVKDISVVQWLFGKPNGVPKSQDSNSNLLSKYHQDDLYVLSEKITIEIGLFGLGILLGCLHQPIFGVATKLSRLIENEQRSKNEQYSLTTTLLQMFLRAYMPTSTSIGYDITSRAIINYQHKKQTLRAINSDQTVNKNCLSKIKTNTIIEAKALASSLKGLIEISALYLTSPLIYVVTGTLKSVYSALTDSEVKSEPNLPFYQKWARYSFFAFDKVTDGLCNFIPGGKMIMNSLEVQEQAVIEWSRMNGK